MPMNFVAALQERQSPTKHLTSQGRCVCADASFTAERLCSSIVLDTSHVLATADISSAMCQTLCSAVNLSQPPAEAIAHQSTMQNVSRRMTVSAPFTCMQAKLAAPTAVFLHMQPLEFVLSAGIGSSLVVAVAMVSTQALLLIS